MKISKLFHWLYAFLMFLPVLALAPSLFYFAFNQQSQNYTDVSVNETYEYETNEVNSVSDLIEGNIYKWQYTNNFVNKIDINFNFLYLLDDTEIYSILPNGYFSIYDNVYEIAYNVAHEMYLTRADIEIYNTYFVYQSLTDIDTSDGVLTYILPSDYLGEKNVEVVRSEQSPMNIFYTAVNYVYDMPVFSWAKNSFLALPITYVTGLFGMASTNVVNYYLSYWLAISIVYLVFDLVMYVPMLVHRWIDKGMIE